MSRALLALLLLVGGMTTFLKTVAAADGDLGGIADPNGGPRTNVGNTWDPNGEPRTQEETDVGNSFDPNG